LALMTNVTYVVQGTTNLAGTQATLGVAGSPMMRTRDSAGTRPSRP
jgi:hypothetical protein